MDEAMDEAMQSAENCDRWMKRTTEKKEMFKYNPFSCFGVLRKGDCCYCLTLLGLSPKPKAMKLPVRELTTLHKNKTGNYIKPAQFKIRRSLLIFIGVGDQLL